MSRRRRAMDGSIAKPDMSGPSDADLAQSEDEIKAALELKMALERLPEFSHLLHSDNIEEQLRGATELRQLLSIEKNPPIQEVVDAGVVPRLAEMLNMDQYPQLQFEACWSLTNIASGLSKFTKCVVDENTIPTFVRLMWSENEDVREQSVWALGTLRVCACVCACVCLQTIPR